jgi:hypothetical protein
LRAHVVGLSACTRAVLALSCTTRPFRTSPGSC